MNLSAAHHVCVCLVGMHAGRVTLTNGNPFLRSVRPHFAPCRNMSIWYMAKNRIKRAWSEQVKIGSSGKIQRFGIEIGTADVLASMGARVQFTNGKWYTRSDISHGALPMNELKGHFVVAVDAKETDLDQFSMVDVVKLSHLKYLSLESCPLIDDHCLASLVHLRDTLTHLNINKCPAITENGVGVLHKLRNLERLNMNDMPKVNYALLVAVMLEDVNPRLRISLVSQQVEKYMENAREGIDIINKHRRAQGLAEDNTSSWQDGEHPQQACPGRDGEQERQGSVGGDARTPVSTSSSSFSQGR